MRVIKLLFSKLTDLYILDNLNRVEQFYDDPKFPQFGVGIKNVTKYTDGHPKVGTASGSSFVSVEEALVKCLSEAAERFCLATYRKNQITYSSYSSLKENALDPFLYTGYEEDREKEIGWVSGGNLTNNSSCLVPAQLVFFNYILGSEELSLRQPGISTGGAGGFDKESVLLNGIYEVIERDAFMNAYLNSISLPRINIKSIKNKTIGMILEVCDRYKLELHVFDASNDLQIPTYVSVLLDRTGLGAPISVGAKTGLREENAILGSVMESLTLRTWLRRLRGDESQAHTKISGMARRALGWGNLQKINDLHFLLSAPISKKETASFRSNKKNELLRIVKMIGGHGYKIYYADITHPELKKIGYLAYKAIIPGLQPLYLDERYKKYINMHRLRQVAKFFGKENFSINSIPHPFI